MLYFMKKSFSHPLIILLMAITMMTSCVTTRSTSQINKVEVGMTRNEVTFDPDGKVIAYETIKEHPHHIH